jgi:hypothetical protein
MTPRYLGGRVEAQGYAKAKDLIAYIVDTASELPDRRSRFIAKRMPKNMTVRNLDTKRYREEFDTVTRSSTTPGRRTGASSPSPRPRSRTWPRA